MDVETKVVGIIKSEFSPLPHGLKEVKSLAEKCDFLLEYHCRKGKNSFFSITLYTSWKNSFKNGKCWNTYKEKEKFKQHFLII